MCTFCETTGAYFVSASERVHVSAFLSACICVCVRERESECPLSSGEENVIWHIWLRVAMFFVQYLAFFSPWNWKPGHCKSIWRLKSDPELWSDLEPKQREKQCRETSSLVLCDLCGAWISPIVLHSQNSVSGWREERSGKFTVQFTKMKLHTVCEVDFSCTTVSQGSVSLRQVPVFLLYLAF